MRGLGDWYEELPVLLLSKQSWPAPQCHRELWIPDAKTPQQKTQQNEALKSILALKPKLHLQAYKPYLQVHGTFRSLLTLPALVANHMQVTALRSSANLQIHKSKPALGCQGWACAFTQDRRLWSESKDLPVFITLGLGVRAWRLRIHALKYECCGYHPREPNTSQFTNLHREPRHGERLFRRIGLLWEA